MYMLLSFQGINDKIRYIEIVYGIPTLELHIMCMYVKFVIYVYIFHWKTFMCIIVNLHEHSHEAQSFSLQGKVSREIPYMKV